MWGNPHSKTNEFPISALFVNIACLIISGEVAPTDIERLLTIVGLFRYAYVVGVNHSEAAKVSASEKGKTE